MDNCKYPMPRPDQRNANANHGTSADKTAKANNRGTMGHKSGVYGGK